MQDQGLIPGNQYAMWLGPIGYHNYEGLVSTPEEGQRLAKNFGKSQVVIQKGHGLVLWGHSVAEAYMLAFLVNRACEVQIASSREHQAIRAAARRSRHHRAAGQDHYRWQGAVQRDDLEDVAPKARPRRARVQELISRRLR